MNNQSISKEIIKAVAILAGIVLLGYFLFMVRGVISYVFISLVVTLIASPILKFLKKVFRFPHFLAVITSLLLFVGVFFGIFSLFIPLVYQQGESLSLLNTERFYESLNDALTQIEHYLIQYDINLQDELKNTDVLNNITQFIPNFFNTLVGFFGNFSIGFMSVLFITFFLMKDQYLLRNSISVVIYEKSQKKVQQSLNTIHSLLSRYFLGILAQISILFVIYTSILLIFGIKNALVIAFLCALLNIIPYVGPIIGGLFMLLLSITSSIDSTEFILSPNITYIMIFYLVAQLIDNFVSQPVIFSNSTKSHPLEIFLVIIISGVLFGITGMIVAVPVYTSIKVILKSFLSENKIIQSLTKDI